ncbi:LOW QUALITY PROTEIN: integrin alpha-E-like [Sarcophilus harrisii]
MTHPWAKGPPGPGQVGMFILGLTVNFPPGGQPDAPSPLTMPGLTQQSWGHCCPPAPGHHRHPQSHHLSFMSPCRASEGLGPELGTESAIVLDGSGSIDHPLPKAKDFIYNMMETFYTKCFKVADAPEALPWRGQAGELPRQREHWGWPEARGRSPALVPFLPFALAALRWCSSGAVIQTEFDLNDSRDARALQRVRNGSQENASKVRLRTLTDDDIFNDSLDLSTVIQSPSMAGIERFAIGVGDAFNKTKANQELHLIASDTNRTPSSRNFRALGQGLRGGSPAAGQPQARLRLGFLWSPRGCPVCPVGVPRLDSDAPRGAPLPLLQEDPLSLPLPALGEALQFELAQVGFSAHVLGKQFLLSLLPDDSRSCWELCRDDWTGGAMLYNTESHQFRFLNESLASHTAQYSYLGEGQTGVGLLSGGGEGAAAAPWTLAGAPRHGHKGRVLWFRPEDPARGFLPVRGEQMGSYFGSELCALDVNADGLTDHLLVGAPVYHVLGEEGKVYVYRVHAQGFTPSATLSGRPQFAFARFGDGLGDVAIGAPLEGFPAEGPASFGSIYIYNGLPRASPAAPLSGCSGRLAPGLRYFGSISGGGDLSGDGLVDVSVGSLGRAAVLRSRAVVRLRASMTFAPSMMRPGDPQNINSTLCFKVTPERPGKGAEELSLNVTVELDVSKRWKHEFCSKIGAPGAMDWLSPRLQQIPAPPDGGEVGSGPQCPGYHLNPLGGRGASPRPVLDELSEPTAHFQLPFEKDCKNQSACVAELKLTARLSPETIVVGVTKEVTMNIHLANAGEDSFLTRMTLVHPPNLQLKRIQKPSSPAVECADPTPAPRVLVMSCKIGSAVFKTSHVNFSITWQLDGKTFPSETAEITINVTNANGQPPVIKRQKLQVKYILVVALDKSLVMYVDTSRGLPEYKEFQFNIHGENPFGAKFVFEVCVPTKMQGHEIITLKNITATQCRQKPGCRIRLPGGLSEAPDLQWLQLSCALSRIPSAVRLGAQLSPQLPRAPAVLCIPAEISFDGAVYENQGPVSSLSSNITVLLEDHGVHILPIILGSSAGGILLLIGIIAILWKCGFFKRKYQAITAESRRNSQNPEKLIQDEN